MHIRKRKKQPLQRPMQQRRQLRKRPSDLKLLNDLEVQCSVRLYLNQFEAAKQSEDAQKARKEAETAHSEKKNALTDAAETKPLVIN